VGGKAGINHPHFSLREVTSRRQTVGAGRTLHVLHARQANRKAGLGGTLQRAIFGLGFLCNGLFSSALLSLSGAWTRVCVVCCSEAGSSLQEGGEIATAEVECVLNLVPYDRYPRVRGQGNPQGFVFRGETGGGARGMVACPWRRPGLRLAAQPARIRKGGGCRRAPPSSPSCHFLGNVREVGRMGSASG
jgi:hypothetical protein